MDIAGIDNVGIAVRDLDAVSSFFADQVGFEVTRYDDAEPPSAVVTVGERYMYLFRTGSETPSTARSAGLVHNPPGLDHISFRVDDMDAAYEELSARGVRFDREPTTDEQWGLRLVGFADPEGNRYFLVADA